MTIVNLPRLLLSASLSGLLFLAACKRSDTPPIETPSKVSASVKGRVLDENRNPVSNATVRAGTGSASTDVNGNFTISNVALNTNAGLVTVEKSGYFKGSRTVVPQASATHFIEIQLIPKTTVGSFTGTAGGTINTGSGGGIVFGANAVSTSSGAAYTGTVSVSAFTFDPSSASFRSQMPGELRGNSASNVEQGLQSFAMMAIELSGAGGEALNLATGKTATISFPIPASLQASAPASIPLWYFDETTGLWKEQGTAAKQGALYVGTVSHFSFWNCDAPFPLVGFSATVNYADGSPMPGAIVEIRGVGADSTRRGYGYTAFDGGVHGFILANAPLSIKIWSPCGSVVYTANIGPYSSAANLGVITTTSGGQSSVNISGTVTNCSSVAVANGYVSATYNGSVYRATIGAAGSYSISMPGCNPGAFSVTVSAFDAATLQTGTGTVVTGTTGTTATANLQACGAMAQYFVTYQMQGATYSFASPADSLMAGYNTGQVMTYISTYSRNSGNLWNALDLYMTAAPGTTGPVPVTNFLLRRPNGTLQDMFTGISLTANITTYGSAGTGFIEGNFTGTVHDTAVVSSVIPISGNFKVKRNQ
jgi:hypothetical protein